jgi:hypothetical protein
VICLVRVSLGTRGSTVVQPLLPTWVADVEELRPPDRSWSPRQTLS